jgi:PAS domain-containing protein
MADLQVFSSDAPKARFLTGRAASRYSYSAGGFADDAVDYAEYGDEDVYTREDIEKERLLDQIVELRREVMRMERAAKVREEIEQRYLGVVGSSVFLYAILTSGGRFRVMNRRAEDFFGVALRASQNVTIQSLAGPGYAREVDFMLKDAMRKPTHVVFPAVRSNKDLGWLDMELSPSVYEGVSSIQIIAFDVTELIKNNLD